MRTLKSNSRALILFGLLFSQSFAFAAPVCRSLGQAVASRNVELVKTCLASKADPNEKYAGNPILTETLIWGLPELAQLLLDSGADPNATLDGNKPILLRLGTGHGARDEQFLDVAKVLAKHHARFEAANGSSFNLLQSLLMRKLPKTFDFVLSQTPKPDLDHLLEIALEYSDLESINILLAKGTNPNSEKAIWKGMHYGPEAHRLALIKSRSFDKKNPLWAQMAASEGRTDTLRELIKIGAELSNSGEAGNRNDRTALVLAIDKNQNEAAKILIAAGAKTEILSPGGYGSLRGETALCLASRKGNLEIVKALIQAKTDVNANCGSVESATKIANKAIVEALINAGADLKDHYTGHWRALFTAAELDNKEIGELIVKAGCPVDVRDTIDSTPLMIAASKGSLNMIRLLVAKGANIEATNSRRPMNDYGSNFIGTPLGWANEYKQTSAASLLKELGAKK